MRKCFAILAIGALFALPARAQQKDNDGGAARAAKAETSAGTPSASGASVRSARSAFLVPDAPQATAPAGHFLVQHRVVGPRQHHRPLRVAHERVEEPERGEEHGRRHAPWSRASSQLLASPAQLPLVPISRRSQPSWGKNDVRRGRRR